jgi:hypothetical protein
VAGYWLTNIIGLVMMHQGVCQMVSEKYSHPGNRRKRLLHEVLISVGYTGIIILSVAKNLMSKQAKILHFVQDGNKTILHEAQSI